MAITVLAMIAGTLAALASAVQVASQHNSGVGTALQHGRVAVERIERALNEATASDVFPGFVSFAERVGRWEFPDTLVVWHPKGRAADENGMPLMSELVVFCPDPNEPNQLLEMTLPTDARRAPDVRDAAAWQAELDAIKNGKHARRVVLTNLLRVATPTGRTTRTAASRGAARFDVTLRPSNAELDDFKAGTLAWNDIAWCQGIGSGRSGLRQAWCRVELQLRSDHLGDNSAEAAIPFFGSGALYYSLTHP